MKVLATNPSAKQDYDILEEYEAGIILTGAEVKSIKNSRIQIKEGFIKIDKAGEIFLHRAYIAPYQSAGDKDYDPYRTRKLLLHRTQIDEIAGKMHGQNLTIVPIKLYNVRRGLIKLSLGLAKGKKKYEKREAIKKADIKREIDRTLKSYQ